MSHKYSQRKAFLAITKAALRSISKSPSSVIFTIAFPLVFILVFGFIGGADLNTIKVSVSPDSDTTDMLYQAIKENEQVKIIPFENEAELHQKLKRGQIDLILDLQKDTQGKSIIHIQAGPGATASSKQMETIIKTSILAHDTGLSERLGNLAEIQESKIEGKEFKTIDFILPGQLGFSLLAASVFGTAFVFFNLRQGLVLKRFFATPVRKQYILLGEGVARMIFQMMGAILIIFIGKFFLGYTLIHGWITFINMLLLCAIGILIFMSFGFIISGIAKSEATVPPLANILTLPQFLLAGTFFPIDSFPNWIQVISKILPLTYLNNALREVAFEGASLWAVRMDIAVLLLWGVIGYFVASKLFKWE